MSESTCTCLARPPAEPVNCELVQYVSLTLTSGCWCWFPCVYKPVAATFSPPVCCCLLRLFPGFITPS